jgi:hypothetical protein
MVSKAEQKAIAREVVREIANTPPWDSLPQSRAPEEPVPDPRLNQIAPNIFSPRFPNQYPRILRWGSMENAEPETEPAQVETAKPVAVPYRDPTVREIQRKLGVKADGIWGPITAAAWNGYVKNLDDPEWQRMGVDPKGSHAPSRETMRSVLLGAGRHPLDEDEFSQWLLDRNMRRMGPQPAPQAVDMEEPDETPRQRELRQRLAALGGR